jgi:hypothetical protein
MKYTSHQKKQGEKKHWMQNAVKHPGSFTASANKAGMGVQQYASKVLAPDSHASGLTKKRASLAKTFAKFRKKG